MVSIHKPHVADTSKYAEPVAQNDMDWRQESPKEIEIQSPIRPIAKSIAMLVFTFLLGFGGGYWLWGRDEYTEWRHRNEWLALYEQVLPQDGYSLAVSYGDLGPRLIEGGAIDYEAFAALYANSANPLTDEQVNILKHGSHETIVITAENAHFLLNFFWAVGLANRNPILTDGALMQYSDGQIERFASTGGWTLAAKPVGELYASMELIPLNTGQQALVEAVAAAVYRPCCNNPTLFPDCNHGMAMLGLLEWMAFHGATADEMFEAAKYVNAFWFPQQALETAIFLKRNMNSDFKSTSARLLTSAGLSSASGFAAIHQNLQASGILPQVPNASGSCAN